MGGAGADGFIEYRLNGAFIYRVKREEDGCLPVFADEIVLNPLALGDGAGTEKVQTDQDNHDYKSVHILCYGVRLRID